MGSDLRSRYQPVSAGASGDLRESFDVMTPSSRDGEDDEGMTESSAFPESWTATGGRLINPRFYPPLAVGDESHAFSDADFRAAASAGKPAPTTPEFARKLHDRFIEAEPLASVGVEDAVRRQADADFAKREAEARAALTERVRAELERCFTDDRTSYYSGDELTDGDLQALADAAVNVFVEFLRDPPTRVQHADGHVQIRWPGGEDDVIARYPADEVGPLDEGRRE